MNSITKLLIFGILIVMPLAVHALTGPGSGNGGDMCEDRIKTVRNDISNWINEGGQAGLTLPAKVTVELYRTKMQNAIATAQISCVDRSLSIKGSEKTCINYTASSKHLQIVCNSDRLMKTSESNQYILIHHEYAGLVGFENNDGPVSNYALSNQISEYLVDETVKRLAVKKSTQSYNCVGPAQVKVINRCSSVRTHPGETASEIFNYQNKGYSISASPDTFEHLYSVSCTDACGNPFEIIESVEWDCVGLQKVASLATTFADADQDRTKLCNSNILEPVPFIEKYFDGLSKAANLGVKPSDLPPAQTGIEYWEHP